MTTPNDDMVRERIGIFGGTFDPPHVAHLIAAVYALEELSLDKILFIPAFSAPHKTDRTFSSASDRLAMTRLAIQSDERFEVSDMEVRRGDISYTIDTLRGLKADNPNAAFFAIVGFDNLKSFKTWHHWSDVLREATVAAIARPPFDTSEIPEEVLARVTLLAMPQLDISSTEIRNRVQQGKSIAYLVPASVGSYIAERRLYV